MSHARVPLRIGPWAGAIVTMLLTGCTSLQEYANERIHFARNQRLARQAWRAVGHGHPIDPAYRKHFGWGFEAGYFDVAMGGKGCPPVLPPKRYWAPCYRTPDGHVKIQVWFDGFEAGAALAQEEGVARWAEIPTALSRLDRHPPLMHLLDTPVEPEPIPPGPPDAPAAAPGPPDSPADAPDPRDASGPPDAASDASGEPGSEKAVPAQPTTPAPAAGAEDAAPPAEQPAHSEPPAAEEPGESEGPAPADRLPADLLELEPAPPPPQATIVRVSHAAEADRPGMAERIGAVVPATGPSLPPPPPVHAFPPPRAAIRAVRPLTPNSEGSAGSPQRAKVVAEGQP